MDNDSARCVRREPSAQRICAAAAESLYETATLDRPLAFDPGEESLHALTAKLLGLKAVNSKVDLIERLEKD